MISVHKVMRRIAILDLYEGAPNEGMRCIRQIVGDHGAKNNIDWSCKEFDVRAKKELPGLDYDVFISSGGPGSPLDSEGTEWEDLYFNWIRDIERFNLTVAEKARKNILFICHSFQLACRYFKIATVSRRRSTAFGVFPVHFVENGKDEPVFTGLQDPFYAVDSRDYQVIGPDYPKLKQMGGSVLAIEKERPHVPLERAVMAVRFNGEMMGTQFHPEADAAGMSRHLRGPEKKKMVIENYGLEKWQSMMDQLNDPDKILWTYSHVLPNFLDDAVQRTLQG